MGGRRRTRQRSGLTWNGTYCMAVGGMVGGGIVSVLGIVVALAGPWAWAALVLAGVVALLAALNYVGLTTRWHQGPVPTATCAGCTTSGRPGCWPGCSSSATC